jgi:DNA polymerase III alpha subunit
MKQDKELNDITRLYDRFIRQCPGTEEYTQRLAEETRIILQLRFVDYFIQICDILAITRDITHMTRGSAGSSLVCYLLGITDVDPVKWGIPIARFLNPSRDDLPDVDIDFPHHRQEEVMNRIFKHWPGRSARISNYVLFKDKSARREAAKRLGAKGKLPRRFTYESVGVDPIEAKRIERKLMGKKRCISKHCGGILMFTRQLPKSLFTAENQILLDKNEVEDLEHLKVDILANRGLSQLLEIDPVTRLTEYPAEDKATADLLCRGDVLGVTQAESPAMRRLFRAIQPKSMQDCVFATALIRPVAVSGRKKATMFHDWSQERMEDTIVYEDDAIVRIAEALDIDKYEADMYRRAFAKKNEEKILEFTTRLGNHPKKSSIIEMLQSLSGFGLCRAHAVNLGRLIWALAYQKAHNTEKFWQACLKHCHGSYRRWVYRTEAKRVGIPVVTPSKSDQWDTPEFQYRKYGWWSTQSFMPGMYVRQLYMDKVEFAGMIANGRVFKGDRGKYVTFLTLGIGNGQYIDITIPRPFSYHDHDVVWGQGTIKYSNNSEYVQCYDSKGYRLENFGKA